MGNIDKKYLRPTDIIDSDHPSVIEYAQTVLKGSDRDPVNMAVKLYYAVRDGIWYDPYYPFYLPEHYRASNIIKIGRGYCVCKAALLCALGRVVGIPSRLGFADVRNHLATKQLIDHLGSDIFTYHGYTDFYLEGQWVKATPAFNIELCERHHVASLEFNGREDSIFHSSNSEKKKFMEYIRYHGTFSDIPLKDIMAAWKGTYGKERVEKWITDFESQRDKQRDFYKEDIT